MQYLQRGLTVAEKYVELPSELELASEILPSHCKTAGVKMFSLVTLFSHFSSLNNL